MFKKILFLFSLYLPFQLAINPTGGIDLASVRVLIILLLFCWLFIGLLQKKLLIPTDPVSLALYSFLFFASFSLFFAENPAWGIRKLLFLLLIFPVYFIFYDASRKNWSLKISRGLVYGSLGVSLVGLVQFFSQFIFGIEKVYAFWGKSVAPVFLGNAFSAAVLEHPSWLVNVSGHTIFRAISVFPDPHMLAFYLGMTAPLALAIYFQTKRQEKKILSAFFIICLTLLLTFSRGGYLGLSVALTIIILSLLRSTLLSSHAFTKIVFSTLLLIGLLSTITPLKTRFFASFDFAEGSNRGRIELWSKALQTIQKNPLGVGIGNLPLAFVPTASYRDPIYAHSFYLDIAAELGIFALLSFVSVFFFALRSLWYSAKNNVFSLGLLASLIFFVAYAAVETPLYSVHIFPLLLILLSFSYVKTPSKNY